jgi:hypothetical protein
LILEKCCGSEADKPMLTTFPAQALPCSGSTGIISAASWQHPEESDDLIKNHREVRSFENKIQTVL